MTRRWFQLGVSYARSRVFAARQRPCTRHGRRPRTGSSAVSNKAALVTPEDFHALWRMPRTRGPSSVSTDFADAMEGAQQPRGRGNVPHHGRLRGPHRGADHGRNGWTQPGAAGGLFRLEGFESPSRRPPTTTSTTRMQPWHRAVLALAAEQRAVAPLFGASRRRRRRTGALPRSGWQAEEHEHVALVRARLDGQGGAANPSRTGDTDPDPPRYTD